MYQVPALDINKGKTMETKITKHELKLAAVYRIRRVVSEAVYTTERELEERIRLFDAGDFMIATAQGKVNAAKEALDDCDYLLQNVR